jgi:hypothetical protein
MNMTAAVLARNATMKPRLHLPFVTDLLDVTMLPSFFVRTVDTTRYAAPPSAAPDSSL